MTFAAVAFIALILIFGFVYFWKHPHSSEDDMTIGSNDNYFSYPGNDVTVDFDGPRSFTAGEVRVRLQNDATGELSEFTAYTLEGVGASKTIVHTTDPVASGYSIVIEHVPNFGQSTNITNQGKYKPEVVEAALDKLAQQCNFLKRLVARRIGVTDNVDLDSFDLPPYLAGAIIGWHASESKLINYLSVDVSDVLVSEYMATFLQAVDAAAARALLEYGSMAMVDHDLITTEFTFDYNRFMEFYGSAGGVPLTEGEMEGTNYPAGAYLYGNMAPSEVSSQRNWVAGCQGDDGAGWFKTGGLFTWWVKANRVCHKCVTWTLSLVAGESSFEFEGKVSRGVGTGEDYTSHEVGLMHSAMIAKESAYDVRPDDCNVGIAKYTTATPTWTVQPVATIDMPQGAIIPVGNYGASGDITVAEGTGVTIQLAGGVTTGDLTLAPGAVGWLHLIDKTTNRWMAGGVGVTN